MYFLGWGDAKKRMGEEIKGSSWLVVDFKLCY
jgi:hypothetical protein